MYAVIGLNGHQYIVTEGDSIVIDSLDVEEGKKIEVKEVLSVFDEKAEKVLVGNPYLEKISVTCEVSAHQKGDKMRVTKFKRKNRYQRTIGFRPKQTVLNIKKINA
ncbi:MAG: 50S ribosomal protein L21 [Candidatus Absconditabacteria bacterium]|nr:50S ribosomal protein L21 [Candidatus Absconditabacteria bacterium]